MSCSVPAIVAGLRAQLQLASRGRSSRSHLRLAADFLVLNSNWHHGDGHGLLAIPWNRDGFLDENRASLAGQPSFSGIPQQQSGFISQIQWLGTFRHYSGVRELVFGEMPDALVDQQFIRHRTPDDA